MIIFVFCGNVKRDLLGRYRQPTKAVGVGKGFGSPFLLYASCTSGAIRCNPGATGIEIIDIRDTIDTIDIGTRDRR